jgi:hypothetical protein
MLTAGVPLRASRYLVPCLYLNDVDDYYTSVRQHCSSSTLKLSFF